MHVKRYNASISYFCCFARWFFKEADMKYRTLGRTGLTVSEIGLGGEWFNGLTAEESTAIVDAAEKNGINYIDIFMPQAPTRSNLGIALEGRRERFIIQGHLCTVFEDGQYTRTRDIEKTRCSFEDLLERLHTDYIDVGMIHYVDSQEDFQTVFEGPILDYVKALKEEGVIRHIGMSSHNPHIALQAVESGIVDVLMFSINPAYDMEAPDTDIYDLMEFKGMEKSGLVVDEARQKLYSACEAAGVAITVMKPLGAGTLLKADSSPFGVAMTVPQCMRKSPNCCAALRSPASPPHWSVPFTTLWTRSLSARGWAPWATPLPMCPIPSPPSVWPFPCCWASAAPPDSPSIWERGTPSEPPSWSATASS